MNCGSSLFWLVIACADSVLEAGQHQAAALKHFITNVLVFIRSLLATLKPQKVLREESREFARVGDLEFERWIQCYFLANL